MPSLFEQSELADLIDKVENGQRLDFDDGVRLIKSQEILTLGYMANSIRDRKNGNQTYFIVNRPVDFANIIVSLEENEKRYTAFMPYGNQATEETVINSLIQLREQQDQNEEFLAFSPIPYYSENENLAGNMGVGSTTGYEDLKILAVSRILLDNFSHIKTFWRLLGPKLAQVSLAFGVDDLDGTVMEERGAPVLGPESSHIMSKRALIHLIQKAGRDAVERDILYRVLKNNSEH